ncbi:PREDICTED: splicing factor, arginine/serine-rich 19-like [Priapulus caudatus]|uniref:Splicing factor, arginine/serine-rich 19-like n=1 Tax=Priapulus caudatus TaxID=37621 RepID=A0ABM1ETQ1_PRICU|nr:PREDICTED: splicing factor, arginine/serine-rich 19-like [Priapulus caudatus]
MASSSGSYRASRHAHVSCPVMCSSVCVCAAAPVKPVPVSAASGEPYYDPLRVDGGPPLPGAVTAGLDAFMENMRQEYIQILYHMRSPQYRIQVKTALDREKENQKKLQLQAMALEKQVGGLTQESTNLLKVRLAELGIVACTPADLLAKAKEIVAKHKDLQQEASKLQTTINGLELDNQKLLQQRQQQDDMAPRQQEKQQQQAREKEKVKEKGKEKEKGKRNGQLNGVCPPPALDTTTQEFIAKEMTSVMEYRKKLFAKVGRLESEVMLLEKTTQENSEKASASNRKLGKSSSSSPPSSSSSSVSFPSPAAAAADQLTTVAMFATSEKELSVDQRHELYRMSVSTPLTFPLPLPLPLPYAMGFPFVKTEPRSPRGRSPKRERERETREREREKEENLNAFEQRVKSIIMHTLNEPAPAPPGGRRATREKSQRKGSTSSVGSSCSDPTSLPDPLPLPIPTQQQHQQRALPMFATPFAADARSLLQACDTPPPASVAPAMRLESVSPAATDRDVHESASLPAATASAYAMKPDYTKSSPAKLALKRHLSEEASSGRREGATGRGCRGVATATDLEPGEIVRAPPAGGSLTAAKERRLSDASSCSDPEVRVKVTGSGRGGADGGSPAGEAESERHGGAAATRYNGVMKGTPVVQLLRLGSGGAPSQRKPEGDDDRKERSPKRRRGGKSPSRGGGGGGGGEGKSPKRQTTAEAVATMMDNATRPLAITAISSPDSPPILLSPAEHAAPPAAVVVAAVSAGDCVKKEKEEEEEEEEEEDATCVSNAGAESSRDASDCSDRPGTAVSSSRQAADCGGEREGQTGRLSD